MLKARHTEDEAIEVGVDEAGRGCLWGPLYAGAVIWPPEAEMTEEQLEVSKLIKDSKKLTAKRRIALAVKIKDLAIAWSVGSVSALCSLISPSFPNRTASVWVPPTSSPIIIFHAKGSEINGFTEYETKNF